MALPLVQPSALWAQDPGGADVTESIKASVGAFLRGARLFGGTEAMLGGEASLHFTERLSVGATGGGLLASVPVGETTAGLGTDLQMGYGGLLVGYELRTRGISSLTARILFGAGHASVRAVPVGNELGADNFLVVEPEFVVHATLLNPVRLGVSVGYRKVFGVQDLPTVVPDDFEGASLTLVLSLR